MNLTDIALSQYGVKEIAGDLHNKTIVDYARDSGFNWVNDDETPWCLDGRIEVLTSIGFIQLKDIPKHQKISVAMVTDKERVKFTDNFSFIIKKHNGLAKEIKSNNIHLICDPTHEFYGVCDGSYICKKKMIKNITKSGIGIPSISIKKKAHSISDYGLKMLAIFISDGYLNFKQLRVGVSKKRKIDILETLKYKSKKQDTKRWGNRKLRTIYVFNVPVIFNDIFQDYKILKWEFVLSLNKRQCKLFIDTYLQFDGNGKNEVFTSSKENQNILNYMASMAGYKSTPYSVKQVSDNSKIEYLHTVYISTNKRRYILPHHVSDIEYDGHFYCVSVPTGKIVIRDFNGTIFQTGNCSIFMNWCAMIAEKPRSKSAAARSWLEVGEHVDMPQTGDIIVLKRGNSTWQGHVGIFVNFNGNYVRVLGGNQSNEVNISQYKRADILEFRRI